MRLNFLYRCGPGFGSLLLLMLSACAPATLTIDINASSYLTAASSLVTHQHLLVPANRARVYLQNGRVQTSAGTDKYHAWCEFEISTLADSETNIAADEFLIKKLEHQRSGFVDGAGIGSTANTLEEFSTIFYLHSARQPDVLRLTCLRRRGTRMQTYLSLNDMQAALGAIMTIHSQ